MQQRVKAFYLLLCRELNNALSDRCLLREMRQPRSVFQKIDVQRGNEENLPAYAEF